MKTHIYWNSYATFPLLEEVAIVGFVDDLTVVVAAKLPENVVIYATETVKVVNT